VVSVRSIAGAACISTSSRAGLGFDLALGERSRRCRASPIRLHHVSTQRRIRPTLRFNHLLHSSDELVPGTFCVTGSLSSSALFFKCLRTKRGRDGRCLIVGRLQFFCIPIPILTPDSQWSSRQATPWSAIDCHRCRDHGTNLSEGPRGGGYELAVLICPPFRMTTGL
jgi:hypothetical protein